MDTPAERVAAWRDTIRHEGDRLLTTAATAWTAPVTVCPGWDVGHLAVHTAGTHRWAAANLTAEGRASRRDLPAPPDGADDALAWCRESLVALLATCDTVRPDREVWTFAGPHPAPWWVRRMAQETGMHRWDAELAAGLQPAPFAPDTAAEGIEEYLNVFLPPQPAETFAGLGGTLHLHATDTTSEWLLDLDDPSVPAQPGHAKADTALRGPASDLLLWLWNRQGPDGLTVFGDDTVVDGWKAVRI